jgi:hypothetical protein
MNEPESIVQIAMSTSVSQSHTLQSPNAKPGRTGQRFWGEIVIIRQE